MTKRNRRGAGSPDDGTSRGDGDDGDAGGRADRLRERVGRADRRTVLKAAGVAGGAALLGGAGALRLRDGDGQDLSDHEAAMTLVADDDATHRATADGRWDDPEVWDGGEPPGDGARAVIDEGATVTVAREEAARLASVRVDGALAFDPTADTRLGVETLVVAEGGELGVGTPDDPVRPDAGATIEFVDRGPIDESDDPKRIGRGLIAMGRTRIVGAETTPFVATATPPEEGDGALELAEEPTGWSAGDRIVVPGLRPDRNEDEERMIAEIDGRELRLDEPLHFDHVPPEDDLDAHVLALDRNVRLTSENDDLRRRGHVMFMHHDVAVRGAGCYDLGRTDKDRPFTNPANGEAPSDVDPNPKARYALHFHHAGIERDEPCTVRECVVWGSPGWGYVNHGSHVVVEDSISYEVSGSGFVAEKGTEVGAFRRNFALRSEGSGRRVDARRFFPDGDEGRIDDFGHGGHGFWMQGPGVAVEENVAAGHRHYGFVYWNRARADEPVEPDLLRGENGKIPNFPVENLDGQADLRASDRVEDGLVPSSYVKLRAFRDNTVFASGGGLEISRHMFTNSHRRYEDFSVIDGFTAYAVGDFVTEWDQIANDEGNLGIKVKYSANLLVRNARLLGGDGTGNGIKHNDVVEHLVVEDSTIRGWERGVEAPPSGVGHLRNCRLENATNVEVRCGDFGHWSPDHRIRLADTTLADGYEAHVDAHVDLEGRLHGILSGDDRIAIDGREAYLDEQAPSFVPFPDEESYEAVGGKDRLPELAGEPGEEDVAAEDLIGASNRELAEYGVAVRGEVLPDDAAGDDRIDGGALAPPDATPTTVRLQADEGEVGAPLSIEDDPTASNGRCVAVGGAESVRTPPRDGQAVYEFEVPAGEYALWARTITPGEESRSFWVAVDDRDWIRWDWIETGRTWHWQRVRDGDADHEPVTVDLSGGTHELVVAYRESGPKLDELFVTDGDVQPFGPEGVW